MASSLVEQGFNLTFELKLDVPVEQVWVDVVAKADVFVMSKSAFSQAADIAFDGYRQ